MADMSFEDIMKMYESQYASASAANLRRYEQAMAIYDKIISTYGPEGGFGRAAEAEIEKQKVRDVAAEKQQRVTTGLYGTTPTGGIERGWEERVGAKARLTLEDIKMQRLSQAQLGKAGFIERVEDMYPDIGPYLQMMQAAAGAGGGAGGGGFMMAGGGRQTWEDYFGPTEPISREPRMGAPYTGPGGPGAGTYGPGQVGGRAGEYGSIASYGTKQTMDPGSMGPQHYAQPQFVSPGQPYAKPVAKMPTPYEQLMGAFGFQKGTLNWGGW